MAKETITKIYGPAESYHFRVPVFYKIVLPQEPAMVQLHINEEIIKTLLSSARDRQGRNAIILEGLYYDLLSDTTVASLSTMYIHLDKA